MLSAHDHRVKYCASALQPLLDEIASLSDRIREYNERVQQIAQKRYPEVARVEQVKGHSSSSCFFMGREA